MKIIIFVALSHKFYKAYLSINEHKQKKKKKIPELSSNY